MMPFIRIQLEPFGMGIRREDRLCPRCTVKLNCHLGRLLEKLGVESRYDTLAIRECDLFKGKEAIQADAIIAKAEFEVRGMKPHFRRWIPEVPEGVYHKDILHGLMILIQTRRNDA